MTSMAQSDEESPPNPVWNTSYIPPPPDSPIHSPRPMAGTHCPPSFDTTRLVLIVFGANLGSFVICISILNLIKYFLKRRQRQRAIPVRGPWPSITVQ